MRLALPSKGRLRDGCVELLTHAGYEIGALSGSGARAAIEGIEMIEMRPRDAAAALAVGQLDAAFLSTDIVTEHELDEYDAIPLGFSRCDLIVASREDDGRRSVADLAGAVVATHLPHTAEQFFTAQCVDVRVVAMGGSLEGVCAAGIADAIVDQRETGRSLDANRLRVLAEIAPCQAVFVRRDPEAFGDLVLRVEAALAARRQRYVMLHLPKGRLDELRAMFPGLESPTVLPLAGRDDLVAVHLVVPVNEFWARLGDLRALQATGIVAIAPEALLV